MVEFENPLLDGAIKMIIFLIFKRGFQVYFRLGNGHALGIKLHVSTVGT